jgi:hypothetical protein
MPLKNTHSLVSIFALLSIDAGHSVDWRPERVRNKPKLHSGNKFALSRVDATSSTNTVFNISRGGASISSRGIAALLAGSSMLKALVQLSDPFGTFDPLTRTSPGVLDRLALITRTIGMRRIASAVTMVVALSGFSSIQAIGIGCMPLALEMLWRADFEIIGLYQLLHHIPIISLFMPLLVSEFFAGSPLALASFTGARGIALLARPSFYATRMWGIDDLSVGTKAVDAALHLIRCKGLLIFSFAVLVYTLTLNVDVPRCVAYAAIPDVCSGLYSLAVSRNLERLELRPPSLCWVLVDALFIAGIVFDFPTAASVLAIGCMIWGLVWPALTSIVIPER